MAGKANFNPPAKSTRRKRRQIRADANLIPSPAIGQESQAEVLLTALRQVASPTAEILAVTYFQIPHQPRGPRYRNSAGIPSNRGGYSSPSSMGYFAESSHREVDSLKSRF
jgi:hypothetical protein